MVAFIPLGFRGLARGHLDSRLHGRKEPGRIHVGLGEGTGSDRNIAVEQGDSQRLGQIPGYGTGGIGHDMDGLASRRAEEAKGLFRQVILGPAEDGAHGRKIAPGSFPVRRHGGAA